MVTIKGVWVFNDTLAVSEAIEQNITFQSNGDSFNTFEIVTARGGRVFYNNITAYDNGAGGWVVDDIAYQTVDFGTTEQTVSDTFYTWLTANATQQADEPEEPEEPAPTPTATFDLSTLNLSAGTHSITVKARGAGYNDSPASEAVQYTA